MTLLTVIEKNMWTFSVLRNLDPEGARHITTATNQEVIEVNWSFKPKRKRLPLVFHFYVGTEVDVVLWESPLLGRPRQYASVLIPNFEKFIWLVVNHLQKPSLKLSNDDRLLIEGGLRAAWAKAIKPDLKLTTPEPPKELESTLELV